MRVTRKQAELNRQRIIESAIRLFAERGVDGVGVAEVMADAGFTHGGFYNHFASKEDLVNEACRTSFARSVTSLRDEDRPLDRLWDYDFGACLSAPMLSEAGKGDNARLSPVYGQGISQLLDILTERHGDPERAAAALSCFVGARVLARAVQRADRDLAHRFESMPFP
ncbi:MAG TPA: TetR family transcriptional regulator [Mycobacterium sp.]|nr:TetR family transcriptional regulator [Mycobacterium sp.]